jgi:hypothetical protein
LVQNGLTNELMRARREHIEDLLVFQHISYFLKDPQEPDRYFNIPLATRPLPSLVS